MAKKIDRSLYRQLPTIKVHQWLKGWDRVTFDARSHRKKPEPHFYIFSIPAAELRSLCGIYRRQTSRITPRASDLGIQRQHDRERSDEIGRFVEFGYPWSTLSEAKRASDEFHDLRKPGWLPTSIVVNILNKGDKREGYEVDDADLVVVEEYKETSHLRLPYGRWSANWSPSALPPLEIIDGQHRLWAFEGDASSKNFEVPVVAFHGLDISWEAYLFWTINIKPKRINASLAFDLYPLLRTEDWLERAEGLPVYRETRSQELTEVLWSHPKSPWYDKINMLGETRSRWVSQAAWIRSLTATFVRSWEARGKRAGGIGGLFGSRLGQNGEVLSWSRIQQSAFLIFGWSQLYAEIHESREPWALSLRTERAKDGDLFHSVPDEDAAFYGNHALINTDQGIRGFHQILNDVCFANATRLKLNTWRFEAKGAPSDADVVSDALNSAKKQPFATLVKTLAAELSAFDWRTSAAADLSEDERTRKLTYRGSSGYREIRRHLLDHLSRATGLLSQTAKNLRAST